MISKVKFALCDSQPEWTFYLFKHGRKELNRSDNSLTGIHFPKFSNIVQNSLAIAKFQENIFS